MRIEQPVVVVAQDGVDDDHDGGLDDMVTVDVAGTDDRQIVTIRASRDLTGLRTARYSAPSVGVSFTPADLFGGDDGVEFLGFAFTQFAMPVIAARGLDFDFHPTPGLHSPRTMLPLLGRGEDVAVLLAPIAGVHEQVITPRGTLDTRSFVWGWHGDLDDVPRGFTTTLGIYRGASPTEVFDAWADDLPSVQRRHVDDNPATSHVSYWTDNGAAYWYRTEPGETIAESVEAAVRELRDSGVAVRAVELDSWFYPHEIPRTIAEVGYPDDVPPTGALRWKPRADAFPDESRSDGARPDDAVGDAIERFRARLDDPPLILHARHLSPQASDVGDDWWVDELAAHPRDPAYFRTWFADAKRWGATCIEQDWMLMYWFGVRELRRVPGRARAWQAALNAAAGEYDIDLIWCMATPADLIAATELDRVISVRTSDDYRFTDDPARLWMWFLTVNRLATTLGLAPFKDCFFSNSELAADDDPIDGDPHAELEALLAAMSSGPVGIGDRRGRTDRAIVMRTCDDDGRLLRPDHPIALIDDCLFGAPERGERLAWATTSIEREGTRWWYVLAINVSRSSITDPVVDDALSLHDVIADSERVDWYVYDWRTQTGEVTDRIAVELAPREWALFVCCPVERDDDGVMRATIGDPTKYATTAAEPHRWQRVAVG